MPPEIQISAKELEAVTAFIRKGNGRFKPGSKKRRFWGSKDLVLNQEPDSATTINISKKVLHQLIRKGILPPGSGSRQNSLPL